MNKNKIHIPWVEKYRPNKVRHVVHQDELIKTLKNVLKNGEMQNLLFYGPPGTGKTTTILALAYELFGPHKINERVLELNASDDRGINIVRNEIITFAKFTIGNPDPNYICPPFKILILDEADAMTPDAQSALRKVMEDTSSITRFCIICNYVDKIIEPIISRCMGFRFIPIDNCAMCKRLKYIANKEKLNISDDLYDAILDVVDGDLRKGIMLLQNISYMYNANKNISISDVYDLAGCVPYNVIEHIISTCMTAKFDEIVKLAKYVDSQGYSFGNLCCRLCKRIIESDKITDKLKMLITTKITSTACKINEGSTDTIQLLVLFIFIRNKFVNQ